MTASEARRAPSATGGTCGVTSNLCESALSDGAPCTTGDLGFIPPSAWPASVHSRVSRPATDS
jgi:hypothetical protein